MSLPFITRLALCLFVGSGFQPLAAGESEPSNSIVPARLNVLVSDAFFASVNRTDAMTSMKLWVETIGKGRNLKVTPQLEIIESIEEAAARLNNKSADLLVLESLDFVKLTKLNLIEAVAAGGVNGKLMTHQYLLLVREGSAAQQVSDLAGKNIFISSRSKSDFGVAWTESILAESQLGRVKSFFGSTNSNYRASACVLPLFFGKADACVVDSINFDLLKELNPQLSKLRVIARSATVFEGLVAMPIEPHPMRGELIAAILELHKHPAGEQLVTAFRIGQMVTLPPGAMEGLRRNYSKIFKLTSAGPKRQASVERAPVVVDAMQLGPE